MNKTSVDPMSMALTRRESLKLSGLALGGLILGGAGAADAVASDNVFPYSLPPCTPGTETLANDEMRITFCGTWYTPRMIQACNSVFVELGNGDSFVFDCGSGVVTKYVSLGIAFSRMDKIFLTHLHGDHMSDLPFIYCFGPSSDRKTPLYVWGPTGDSSDEGTEAFCNNMYAMSKWHRESFSFLPTGYTSGGDGYDLEVKELPYMDNPGIAYHANNVLITHFPAIHARDGGISYKLEWKGLSMVFTGDTKPNNYVLQHAKGVDVLIHEMTPPADVWTTKQTGWTPADGKEYFDALALNAEVIESSHTLQNAFGYILSQTKPRLGVGTHFPNDNDLIEPAMRDIRSFYNGPVSIARDLMVINVTKKKIRQRMAVADKFPWFPHEPFTGTLADPKYHGPLAQLNSTLLDNVIPREDYSKRRTKR